MPGAGRRPGVRWEDAVVTIIAAADGSALGNPGPAGWGWYVDDGCWAAGGWPHGTNNMGELTAVLDLLQQTAHLSEDLLVYCDSTYVINSITKWMPGWKRRGWKKGDGKPVLNVEIMKALDAAMAGRRVRFVWVKGHAGHELNEAADRLATAAAAAWKDRAAPDPGPGFAGSPVRHPEARPGQVVEEPDLFSDL
jgi:ribonuclease HI